jgi:predicted nucleic-acid-binding Zn-ribbon protein
MGIMKEKCVNNNWETKSIIELTYWWLKNILMVEKK